MARVRSPQSLPQLSTVPGRGILSLRGRAAPVSD
ncbi:hypothetical protein [Azospirillum endophyticum]